MEGQIQVEMLSGRRVIMRPGSHISYKVGGDVENGLERGEIKR